MIKKRLKRCISALCLASIFLCGCQKTEQTQTKMQTGESDQNMPKIIVGCDKYPPFNYIGTDGQPTGIDVELAKEAFKRMGYQVKFEFVDWTNKKQLVENGEIDCIWCCFSMDGREDDYQWAGPYMISRQVVAVMPDSDIKTLEDLKGKKVAVQATTKPEEIFLGNKEQWQLEELFSLQNRELIYAFLSKGYADAVAAHETSILQYMADYNVEYRILEEPLQTVGLGVAFALSDDRNLNIQLEQTLTEMRNDGTTSEIIGRYLEHPEQYIPDEDIKEAAAYPEVCGYDD